MNEVILIKNGELALKGLNRGTFEEALLKNLRYRLKPLGNFILRKAQSTVYLEPQDENMDWDEVSERVATVFGISAFSRACVVEKDLESIQAAAAAYLAEPLSAARTFKVEAKRADKQFP